LHQYNEHHDGFVVEKNIHRGRTNNKTRHERKQTAAQRSKENIYLKTPKPEQSQLIDGVGASPVRRIVFANVRFFSKIKTETPVVHRPVDYCDHSKGKKS